MESRNVSVVSSSKVTVQSSRRVTTTVSSSSDGDTTSSMTSEYNVRQIGTAPDAGQTQQDEQTGLPRVEMVFSADSLQRPTQPVLTVYCESILIGCFAACCGRSEVSYFYWATLYSSHYEITR